MKPDRSSSREEIIGRLALVALAALLAIPASVLFVMGTALAREAPDGAKLVLLFFIGGTFLYLVAIAFVIFAFLPGRDSRRGPPRGFTILSAVFDGFWSVVRRLLELP